MPSHEMLAALDSGFAERSVEAGPDGARVSYRSGGSQGPVIVLLHGISSGAASWLPCASLLAARARVIAWDAPGYGNSTPLPQAEPKASDYALRLEGMLRALGVRPDLVVEVCADLALDGLRWRHPVRLVRVRSDLRPTDVNVIDEP